MPNAGVEHWACLHWALSIPHASAPAHRRCGVVSRRRRCSPPKASAQQRAAGRTTAAASRRSTSVFLTGRAGGRRAGGGGGAARQGGAGRGRQAGPAPPAPRSAEGRVLLGGATPKEKGVWLPGGGGPRSRPADCKDIPSSRGRGAARRPRQSISSSRTRGASRRVSTRPFLTPYGVEFVELPELQRIYIFDIGGPHTYPHDLHGWPVASGELSRRAITATRSAGGKATRWSSTPSASTKASGSIGAARLTPSKLHTLERFTRTDAATISTKSRSTIRALTRRRGRAGSTCAGKTAPSCSSTCASRRTTRRVDGRLERSVDRRSPIIP